MNRYKTYCTEDFVLDAEFQKWVRYKSASQAEFWNNFREQFPEQAQDINEARLLLESVYIRCSNQIDEQEIESEIAGLVTRILQDREAQSQIFEPVPKIPFTKKPLLQWLSAATITVLLGLSGWYGINHFYRNSFHSLTEGRQRVEKINNTSKSQKINLADGSVVILEPSSRLEIPETFSPEKREVYLYGEAYFKITKDTKRPFFVYTERLVTRVLGTSFVVKALKGADETSVEVKEGKVSVFKNEDFRNFALNTKNESKGILVSPNQKIVLENHDGNIRKMLSQIPSIITDSHQIPSFDYIDTPVVDVLIDLKNAYQVDIVFDADLLSNCSINANLSHKSLIEQLSAVCEATEAKYEVLDGKIIVYGKNCQN